MAEGEDLRGGAADGEVADVDVPQHIVELRAFQIYVEVGGQLHARIFFGKVELVGNEPADRAVQTHGPGVAGKRPRSREVETEGVAVGLGRESEHVAVERSVGENLAVGYVAEIEAVDVEFGVSPAVAAVGSVGECHRPVGIPQLGIVEKLPHTEGSDGGQFALYREAADGPEVALGE